MIIIWRPFCRKKFEDRLIRPFENISKTLEIMVTQIVSSIFKRKENWSNDPMS